MAFFKKYSVYLSGFLITGLLIYDDHFINKYKTSYKAEGLYTAGKIQEIKPYGRGTGCDFVYTFQTGGKTYQSETDINPLNFYEAKALPGKTSGGLSKKQPAYQPALHFRFSYKKCQPGRTEKTGRFRSFSQGKTKNRSFRMVLE